MPFEGDNMMGVKRNNRSATLRILHEKGDMSRKRLAEYMKLTPPAITKIVAELLEEGLLREGSAVTSGSVGRREILVELNTRAACALGVLLNLRQAEKIIGVGVAVRGITSEDGSLTRDTFGALAETDFPLRDTFARLTGLPCVMENNVRSLLAAHMFLSRDETAGSQFFLRCGYGIGAALSIDGRIWHGVTAQCAEIGHIPVIRRGGKPCHCGKSGCLETIASPGSIREDAIAILSEERTPLLWRKYRDRDTDSLSVFDVFTAASYGDEGASEIVDRAIQALGGALKSVIYLVDPGKIVLYGSLFEDPYYLSRLMSELQEGADARHNVTIEKSRFNQQLEDKAACLLAVQDFFDNGGIP